MAKKKAAKPKKQNKKDTPEEVASTETDEELDEVPETVESLSREETGRAVYAMLFSSDRPLNIGRIAEALGDIEKDVVEIILEELMESIEKDNLPYRLREISGGYQLTTLPEYAPYIRRMLDIKKSAKLSKAVLETLAIIAYRQPVTRPDVESIRGVSVSHAFGQLQERNLIKAVGVADVPGRPRLFRTTDDFLDHFGIKNLKEMPSVEELQELE
ncbi:MAG: SMC-Scp complex subunit ScpB [Candidatus Hydrogenedentota bacterium]